MRTFACSLMVFCGIAGFTLADDDAEPATEQASTVAEKTVTSTAMSLKLAYEGESGGDSIHEFIPSDETLETWTRLAAIREYPDLNNPLDFAEAIVKELKEARAAREFRIAAEP